VTIGEKRQAAELRRAREADAMERVWRRKLLWFWARYGMAYGSGLAIIGYAFHTTDGETARTAWEVGFFVAIVAPLAVLLDFWWRELR
jgi:hypothetical protein